VTQAAGKDGDVEKAEEDTPEADKPMTFWEHLDELRRRLLWALGAFFIGCIIGWEFKEQILEFLVIPFDESWKAEGLAGSTTLHFASPGAAFIAYFKLAMIGGGVLASPMIFYQLWSFVAPGLYAREKRYVIPFVILSTALFIGGGLFGWRTAFPITFSYFLSMSGAVGDTVTITPTVMMAEYISFVMQLLLGFGLIFEIPLLLTFLALAGAVNYRQLIKFSRYFIFISFIVAALLTPPDVTSQLIMAIPMCLLYLVSIGLVYIFGPKVPPAEPAAAAETPKSKS
jgi:sec-independent protein translocase protein TatC